MFVCLGSGVEDGVSYWTEVLVMDVTWNKLICLFAVDHEISWLIQTRVKDKLLGGREPMEMKTKEKNGRIWVCFTVNLLIKNPLTVLYLCCGWKEVHSKYLKKKSQISFLYFKFFFFFNN